MESQKLREEFQGESSLSKVRTVLGSPDESKIAWRGQLEQQTFISHGSRGWEI